MATILLVDDVALFLELERSFLENCGHQIVTAPSGEQALALLDSAEPSLILLDLYMPGMDGDEVCRQLRQSPRWGQIPIIMVTAAGKEEQIRLCLDAGCDDYVTKPINKSDLLEKVNRLLKIVKGRTSDRSPAVLRVQLKSGEQQLQASARDISRNGIFVKSRTVLAPGAAVELLLELPGGQELTMLGKVARVQQPPDEGMGIYLVQPQPEGLKALADLADSPAAVASATLPPPGPGTAEGPLGAPNQSLERLAAENRQLHQRILELEEENRAFAQQVITTEEVNNNLTNLYIASSRLHSVLDRKQVLEIIKEVIINFVGAEKFAILLHRKDAAVLQFETGEGFAPDSFPSVGPGEGLLWEVVETETPFFQEGSVSAGSDDPFAPLAAIPLKIHGQTMGMLAIYRLFTQKERFQQVDFQLFSMMAEHAVTALFSSTLYEESERKRETYRGFMELLLK